MPVVIAEPKDGGDGERSQGARSLLHVCLDVATNVLPDEPNPYSLVSTLPELLQTKMAVHLLSDRRELQNVKTYMDKIPLMDQEKHLTIDRNAKFAADHPDIFDDLDYSLGEVLRAAGLLPRTAAPSAARCLDGEVLLVENTTDSLLRFSICATFEHRRGRCRHRKHFKMGDLISPQLLERRLKLMKNERDWKLEDTNYDDPTTWTHGDLRLEVYLEDHDEEPDVTCVFKGDIDCVRGAEIYLNALLSPIERIDGNSNYGEEAFARCLSKLLELAKVEKDSAANGS
ncbi:uncharacterized protein AB675_5261 [Cyphellophora attinorum]|uniref:Uncharacterized protein n=1 Tax=Cyphellophora attinorum TaxID=1664694 RepID=A0A0N1P021_9EURO|nr:uncharacterized protein AB675_5261 [Phialophora attinorum]KPI39254.1 hypothetical protein AB675_5261 [Phialophora attinorum]